MKREKDHRRSDQWSSYRTVSEWRELLSNYAVHHCATRGPESILQSAEGWIRLLEQAEHSMPFTRRWECERHLRTLFGHLGAVKERSGRLLRAPGSFWEP
jgi:hypothetical protein